VNEFLEEWNVFLEEWKNSRRNGERKIGRNNGNVSTECPAGRNYLDGFVTPVPRVVPTVNLAILNSSLSPTRPVSNPRGINYSSGNADRL
jgi:hypothetical protein